MVVAVCGFYEKEGEKFVYNSTNPWNAPEVKITGFLKSTSDMLKFSGMMEKSVRKHHTVFRWN